MLFRTRYWLAIAAALLLFSSVGLHACPGAAGETFSKRVDVRGSESKFYLVSLEANQTLSVNVTSRKGGNFNLYLYNFRPSDSAPHPELNSPQVSCVVYDETANANASISFTSLGNRVYYLQVVLATPDPDTFFLDANKELTPYFIPFLPGFPVGPLIVAILLAGGLEFAVVRKRRK